MRAILFAWAVRLRPLLFRLAFALGLALLAVPARAQFDTSAVGPSGRIMTGRCLQLTNTDGTLGQKWCPNGGSASKFTDTAGATLFSLGGTGTLIASTFFSTAASGANAYGVSTNGAHWHVGAGANDWFNSDGTTVTFNGPLSAVGTIHGGSLIFTDGNSSFVQANGAAGGFKLANNIIVNSAPTVSSGFGTSPSVTTSNGTAAFTVNVGTGGVATSGVIGLPTATNGWVCVCQDLTTTSATVFITKQTATSATSCTVGNFNTAAAAAAWVASDILHCIAMGR